MESAIFTKLMQDTIPGLVFVTEALAPETPSTLPLLDEENVCGDDCTCNRPE